MKEIKFVLLLLAFLVFGKIQAQIPEFIDSSATNDAYLTELMVLDAEIEDHQRNANVFGGLSVLGLLGVGAIYYKSNNADVLRGRWHFLFTAGLFATLTGVKGLNHHDKKKYKIRKRKALLLSQKLGHTVERPELYLGMTANGIGLSISF